MPFAGGAAAPAATGGLFGQTAVQPAGGLFGAQKSLFGGTTTAANTGFSFSSPFAATTTTSAVGGLFGPKPVNPSLCRPAPAIRREN